MTLCISEKVFHKKNFLPYGSVNKVLEEVATWITMLIYMKVIMKKHEMVPEEAETLKKRQKKAEDMEK